MSQLKHQQSQDQEALADEKAALLAELEQLNAKASSLEQANIDLNSQLERERMLHEAKVQFVQQQRDQAKSDLAEQARKFEFAVESMKKRAQSELEKSESEHAVVLASTEKQLTATQAKVVEVNSKL